MRHAHPARHPVRTFGLWALGGAMAYLILRELTTTTGPGRRAAGPTTPSTLPPASNRDVERDNGDADEQLDAAIDATFPASDPISMQFE
jgi:hypothetical protein